MPTVLPFIERDPHATRRAASDTSQQAWGRGQSVRTLAHPFLLPLCDGCTAAVTEQLCGCLCQPCPFLKSAGLEGLESDAQQSHLTDA